mmetsp:Transcript_87121/g.247000  ORF Transcript_87121/g.247000 Transcript_87121/m.247000 type:complete len:434 (-) Transcript_87121:109-1410(-)
MLQKKKSILKEEDFAARGSRFGIALSWDRSGGHAVDLDLQGIAFDAQGKLLDAVYYNNLKALGRGLTHSGDEVTGDKEGFDEAIWVNFPKMAATVPLLVFIVACYKGGSIHDARNGRFHLLEDRASNEVGQFRLENFAGKAAIIGSLMRKSGGWVFRTAHEVAMDGQHFIDILEPTIGNYVRRVIPGAPRRLKAAFAMEKGSVVDLPQAGGARQTVAALGWDTSMGEVDLDVSAVLLDGSAHEIECVFFGNEEAQGIKHSGDNLTGDGSGDDESVCIELDALSKRVEQIFFVVNIYTKGRTFAQVANPYCRLVTSDGEEFCRYQLTEAGSEQALIMARLFREPGNRWGFQAVGAPCRGQTYKDSMPAVLQYARTRPSDLGMRSVSSAGSGRPPGDSCRSSGGASDARRHSRDDLILEGEGKPALCSGNGCGVM